MKDYEDARLDLNNSLAGAYEQNQMCLDDYEFAMVSGAMWKGSYAEQFRNKPKPEINQIFSSINRVLGQKQRLEMNATIVSNSDEATDEDADILQARWRNDFNSSDGVEATNNADQEAFFSGFGAYRMVSKYEDEENPNPDKQYLCIEPVVSAASTVFFSPSLRKDKADAKQGWYIIRTNRKEVEEEYGVDSVTSINSQTNWFDWYNNKNKDIYLAHYYEVVTKNITEYDFDGYKVTAGDGIKDQDGNKLTRDDLKELKDNVDYTSIKRKVKYVEYALMSGSRYLTKPQRTPFKRVPIFPQYGYYCVLNGIEYYCGEVRKRRDPQMFFNTFYSSLMEIMAAPQVRKPEYTPEQIARHAGQRAKDDIDNSPFVMSDPVKNKDGSIAHLGPVGYQEPPQIGSGLATAGQQLQTTLLDMAGTGQSTLPSNVAADAIAQVNERNDDAFQPLMQNSVAANKAMCEAWIDAAQRIYFTNQRKIRIQGEDGSYSQIETMQYAMNENNEYGPFKNSARGRFTVQVKIGESFASKKDAERKTVLEMLQYADTNSPQGQMLLNQAIINTTGQGGDRSREVAKYQLIDNMMAMGLDPKPKNDEERQYIENKIAQMQAAQQNQQPDAATLMAQAEMMKAQADMQEQNNKRMQLELEAAKLQQEGYKIALSEQKQAADIGKTRADTMQSLAKTEQISNQAVGEQIDNMQKVTPSLTIVGVSQ